MRAHLQRRWQAAILSVVALVSMCMAAIGPAKPAHAYPGCVNGGVYVLFVRGSGEKLNDVRADAFYWALIGSAQYPGKLTASGVNSAWAELGNLDGSRVAGQDPDGADEYPAYPAPWSNITFQYGNSVRIGTDELVKHLNRRYGNRPGDHNCSNETVIIGGYSQGADVVGWALERSGGDTDWSFSPSARSHIGSVALYGDPRYLGNFGNLFGCYQPPWAILYDGCGNMSVGILSPRIPYVPDDLWSRVSSYCDTWDGVCHGSLVLAAFGTHTSAYQGNNGWMFNSANRIAAIAISKRNQLNPSLPPAPGGQTPQSGPPPTQSQLPAAINARLVCDANGDGKADALVMFGDTGTAKVALSTGSEFGYPGDWSYGQSRYASDYRCADVNGDGMADLIAYYGTTRKWFVSLSSGSGFWAPTEWAYDDSLLPDRTFFADANGDGKADKIFFIGGNWWVGTSSGSGFYTPQLWRQGHGVGSTDQAVGDFNGDGKADAAVWFSSNGKWHVALSTGSQFGYPGEWSYMEGLSAQFRLNGDANGDGKSDIAYYGTNPYYKWWVGTSSGSGFWGATEWSYDGPGYNAIDNAFMADVNGDGKADKILWYRGTGNWYVGTSSGSGFWPLGAWITGHGAGS